MDPANFIFHSYPVIAGRMKALLEQRMARQAVKLTIDGLLAGLAWLVVSLIWSSMPWYSGLLPAWIALALAVGQIYRTTSQHYRVIGMKDATNLGLATLSLVVASLILSLLAARFMVPPQIAKIAFSASILTGVFWATLRCGCREWSESRDRQLIASHSKAITAHRTLVIGAGRAAALVIQELSRHPHLGYLPVGLVDDAPSKQGVRIQGIPVLGNTIHLPSLIKEHAVTHAILAMPSAPGSVLRTLTAQLHECHIKVKTVPGVFALLGAQVWKPAIQDVSIEDILRRDAVHLDHSALSQAVAGATILITGAGGSIGSELARQVAAFKPGRIILLGRGENSLWTAQRSLESLFPKQAISLELMDIRNRSGLREVFEHYRPSVVLHAAAHKHVPFLETHPIEAVHNNIFGTLNVVEAALDFGTQAFVNISTDKAVNPTNVLGATKRIAECIVLEAAGRAAKGCRFVSVRFGNVLGSRGSVVPIFRDQIDCGGPITVTHPDMTRYFMTIPEASQLVIQAGMLGETARVYLLDMGEAVKILDLATDMARLSGLTPGKDIEIQFVGLRPGEKLHEELCLERERISTAVHSKLFEVAPQGIPSQELAEGLEAFKHAVLLPYEQRQPEVVRLLKLYVPTYKPSRLGVGRFGGYVKDRRNQSAYRLPEGLKCRRTA